MGDHGRRELRVMVALTGDAVLFAQLERDRLHVAGEREHLEGGERGDGLYLGPGDGRWIRMFHLRAGQVRVHLREVLDGNEPFAAPLDVEGGRV
jgi:hypothetical protein